MITAQIIEGRLCSPRFTTTSDAPETANGDEQWLCFIEKGADPIEAQAADPDSALRLAYQQLLAETNGGRGVAFLTMPSVKRGTLAQRRKKGPANKRYYALLDRYLVANTK